MESFSLRKELYWLRTLYGVTSRGGVVESLASRGRYARSFNTTVPCAFSVHLCLIDL